MTKNWPTLLVHRKPRISEKDWKRSSSWLGGWPRLGSKSWPLDEEGRPCMFYAQFDLSEIPAIWPETTLPTVGALAFFNSDAEPVVYIPEGEAREDTPPPGPVEYDEFAVYVPLGGDRPMKWPVGFMASPIVEGEDYDQATERFSSFVEAHFNLESASLKDAIKAQTASTPFKWVHVNAYFDYLLWSADENIANAREICATYKEILANPEQYSQTRVSEAEHSLETFSTVVEESLVELAKLQSLLVQARIGLSGKPLQTPLSEANVEFYEQMAKELVAFETLFQSYPPRSFRAFKIWLTGAERRERDFWFQKLPNHLKQVGEEDKIDFPIWWHSVQTYAQFAATLPGIVEAKCAELQDQLDLDPEQEETKKAQLLLEKNRLLKEFSAANERAKPKSSGLERLIARLFRGKEISKIEATPLTFEQKNQISRLEQKIEFCDTAIRAAQNAQPKAPERLRNLQRAKGPFEQINKAFERLTAGKAPFTYLNEADKEQFMALHAALKETGEATKTDKFSFDGIRIENFEKFEKDTLRILLTSDALAYATIPAATRDAVNRTLLLPDAHQFNQMLGRGITSQGSDDHDPADGLTLLLQIVSDDLMKWELCHDGLVSFWINDKDLNERNWSAVERVFN